MPACREVTTTIKAGSAFHAGVVGKKMILAVRTSCQLQSPGDQPVGRVVFTRRELPAVHDCQTEGQQQTLHVGGENILWEPHKPADTHTPVVVV